MCEGASERVREREGPGLGEREREGERLKRGESTGRARTIELGSASPDATGTQAHH